MLNVIITEIKLTNSYVVPNSFGGVINELAGKTNKHDSFPINKFLPGLPITSNAQKQVADTFNHCFSAIRKNLANATVLDGNLILMLTLVLILYLLFIL